MPPNTNLNNPTVGIVAINSDLETCACCGKTNLKRVVWLAFGEAAPVAYGTNCAAKALGVEGTYTAKTADKLKFDYEYKLKRLEAMEKAKAEAQSAANQFGEEVLVCKSGPLYFYTVRTAAYDFARHGAYYATAKPAA